MVDLISEEDYEKELKFRCKENNLKAFKIRKKDDIFVKNFLSKISFFCNENITFNDYKSLVSNIDKLKGLNFKNKKILKFSLREIFSKDPKKQNFSENFYYEKICNLNIFDYFKKGSSFNNKVYVKPNGKIICVNKKPKNIITKSVDFFGLSGKRLFLIWHKRTDYLGGHQDNVFNECVQLIEFLNKKSDDDLLSFVLLCDGGFWKKEDKINDLLEINKNENLIICKTEELKRKIKKGR